jgi:hypothetical protein
MPQHPSGSWWIRLDVALHRTPRVLDRAGGLRCLLLGVEYVEVMDVREMAQTMGRRGGRARARRLPAERRRQTASLGGRTRHRSLLVARRIV